MQHLRFEKAPHLDFIQSLAGKVTWNASDSCGPLMSLADLSEVANIDIEDLLQQPLGYNSINGSDELLSALDSCGYYPQGCQFRTFSGAQEALFILFNILLEPGDTVVLPEVGYPSLELTPRALCAELSRYSISVTQSGKSVVEQICDKLTLSPKLLIINSPHNPSGRSMAQDDINQIIAVAKAHDTWVLFDDVTAWLDGEINHQTKLEYDRAVSVNVMSKVFGLPGVRVGWMATKNTWLAEQATVFKGYLSICTSRLDDVISGYALRYLRPLMARTVEVISSNKTYFHTQLQRIDDEVIFDESSNGIVTELLLPQICQEEALAFSRYLAEHKHTLILPLSLFGDLRAGFRVGFGNANCKLAFKHFIDGYLQWKSVVRCK